MSDICVYPRSVFISMFDFSSEIISSGCSLPRCVPSESLLLKKCLKKTSRPKYSQISRVTSSSLVTGCELAPVDGPNDVVHSLNPLHDRCHMCLHDLFECGSASSIFCIKDFLGADWRAVARSSSSFLNIVPHVSCWHFGIWCMCCKSYSCEHQPGFDGKSLAYSHSQLANFIFEKEKPEVDYRVSAAIGSFNCQSLNDSSKFRRGPKSCKMADGTRSLQMEQAVLHLKLVAIGFQEARTPASKYQSDNFIKVSSGHDHMCLGTEIWISRVCPWLVYLPDSTMIEVCPSLDDVTKLFGGPRYLCVAIEINGICFYLLNIHAPDSNHGFEAIQKFWIEITALLKFHRVTPSRLLLVSDMNQKLGTVTSPSIGNHCPSIESRCGSCAHKFLKEFAMFLPATFGQYRDGSQDHTFTHSSGSVHRIDYVGLPRCCAQFDIDTSTVMLEYGSSLIDHFLVLARFSLKLRFRGKPKRVAYDSSKFLDPASSNYFYGIMDKACFDAPFSNSTSALAYFNNSVYNALTESFPVDSIAPVQSYISYDTCCEIKFRKHLRSLFKIRNDRVLLCMKRSAFAALKDLSPASIIGESVVSCFFALRFKIQAKWVQKCVSWDKYIFVQDLCFQANRFLKCGNLSSFFHVKRRLTRAKKKAPEFNFVLDLDGKVCSAPSDVKRAHKDNFALKLGGLDIEPLDLIKEHFTNPLVGKCIHVIDTDVGKLFRSGRAGSAPGNDRLGYGVFAAFEDILVPPMVDISNMAADGDCPLQWCGSILQEVYKKGSSSVLDNYRDVQLADVSGKVFKRSRRAELLPYCNSYISDSMCGGFLKRGTDFCSHFIRTKQTIARLSGLCFGILFIDVVGAFASVVRSLITSVELPDEYIAYIFKSLKFDAVVFHEFRLNLLGDCAFNEAGVPLHLQESVNPYLLNTWFTVDKCPGVTQYTLGSGAGNPLADITFTFLMAKILRQCQDKLAVEGLIEPIPAVDNPLVGSSDGQSHYDIGCSYVDDSLFHTVHEDPFLLVENLVKIAAVVFHVFFMHALLVNCKPGKTNFMLQLRGRDAKAAKLSFF